MLVRIAIKPFLSCSLLLRLSYLVFLQTTLGQGFISLLLERDNNQGHEDVDEKEGEDNKVDHVEDGHLDAVARTGTLVLKGGIYRVLQNPENTTTEIFSHYYTQP